MIATMLFSVKINVKAENSDMPKVGITSMIDEIDTFIVPPRRTKYLIVGHNGKKTFMGYKSITNKVSNQYALQQEAYTDEEGFRKINNRYCVAIGTAFNAEVGQHFDAELENGTIIECIVGDIKDNKDTDATNTFTSQGCCLEFIVDSKKICDTIKYMGDCSYKCEEWNSPCLQYIVYDDLNFLKKGED
jgi:hypothetical protein